MATMSAVAGFAPVASSPRAFHRRAGRRPNLPHAAAAASREPPSSPPDGKSLTDPEKSNNVVGRESSAATLAVEEVRAWCIRTDGGVLATEADVASLRATGKSPDAYYEPKTVMRRGLAVCSGYARLLRAMCDTVPGLRCENISGYGGGRCVWPPLYEESNHEWNALSFDDGTFADGRMRSNPSWIETGRCPQARRGIWLTHAGLPAPLTTRSLHRMPSPAAGSRFGGAAPPSTFWTGISRWGKGLSSGSG